ncbi:hypothetical protein CISIN_1g042111mg [Citrus sinensis]|uniref:Uncharacterized protein n=1 Tax=Citrus sinensis TaxID=2711 RepID=A0A067DF86_CITSI|nr:hypothetical protein CISIN_1g042111mg [Citrus sinensis]
MCIITNGSIFPFRLAFNLIGLISIFISVMRRQGPRGDTGQDVNSFLGTEPFPVPVRDQLVEISLLDILRMYLLLGFCDTPERGLKR